MLFWRPAFSPSQVLRPAWAEAEAPPQSRFRGTHVPARPAKPRPDAMAAPVFAARRCLARSGAGPAAPTEARQAKPALARQAKLALTRQAKLVLARPAKPALTRQAKLALISPPCRARP